MHSGEYIMRKAFIPQELRDPEKERRYRNSLLKKLVPFQDKGAFERWATVFTLLITGRVLFVNFFTRHVPMGGIARGMATVDPTIRLVTVTGYLLALSLAWMNRGKILRALGRNANLVVLVSWFYLSVLWSSVPLSTLTRFAGLTGTTLLGFYLGTRYALEELPWLVGRFVLIATVISLVLVLFFPGMGRYVELRGEVWSGAFVHKNSLGMIMALGFVFLLYAPTAFTRLEKVFFLIGGGALLWFSDSRGAQGITLIMVLLSPYLKRLIPLRGWKRVTGFLVGLSILGILGVWVWRHLPLILRWMGRDPSLTGRTLIWMLVWKSIQKKFWMGYGFEAFWSGEGQALLDVWRYFPGVWIPTHSHNGLLELWLNGGAVAVGLFFVHWFRTGFLALRKSETAWPMALWVLLTVYSGVERTIFNVVGTSTIIWVLYLAISVHLRLRGSRGATFTDPS